MLLSSKSKVLAPAIRMLIMAVAILFAGLSALIGVAWLLEGRLPDYRDALSAQRARLGFSVVDRHGRPLRLVPGPDGQFGIWRPIDRVPACVKHAFIASEDQRFLHHPGFDPLAMARALRANLARWRTVSGASTITQQVVRLIEPRPRTLRSKAIELAAAVKMERQLSKDQILELYLNLSPMGGNIRGVGLAARSYFSKDIESLNPAEAALLAVLPRSPSRLDPRKPESRKSALAAKDPVLERMAARGGIAPEQLTPMKGESAHFAFQGFPCEAPHLVDRLLTTGSKRGAEIRSTIDLDIQHQVERILNAHRSRLAGLGIRQAGALIVDMRSAQALAMVGSLGYASTSQGFNNAVFAARGAGSTLKPFLYALALEKGYQAYSEIPDTFRSYPTPHGDYLPLNADRRFYGPVNLRVALGNSLNISSIKLVKALGVEDFYDFLKRLDLVHENAAPADHYGLGLAVGNIEADLFRLVQAYCALANGGLRRPLALRADEFAWPTQVMSPQAAYVIMRILADPSARLLTFGNPGWMSFNSEIAIKTGTSSNYRDCWIIGATGAHVIGIWAGNFTGESTARASGAAAVGPIMQEIVRALSVEGVGGGFKRPDGVRDEVICWMSSKPASSRCPYTGRELVIGGAIEDARCDLTHETEQHSLGSTYAQWIDRREKEHGRGRFRLGDGPRVRAQMTPAGLPGTLTPHGPGPVDRSSRVSILSPHNFDRFVLSPHHENRIRFQATADPIVSQVIWILDGVEIARTPPPYEFFWEPLKGGHVVHAVTPHGEAAQVTIRVE
ncbi:MAG: penicillin-binding protein 1C [Deltaproteobacteria bacterium]|nr:penicillin-binding protein 1C [Deltaproteobacteria bacterium]